MMTFNKRFWSSHLYYSWKERSIAHRLSEPVPSFTAMIELQFHLTLI